MCPRLASTSLNGLACPRTFESFCLQLPNAKITDTHCRAPFFMGHVQIPVYHMSYIPSQAFSLFNTLSFQFQVGVTYKQANGAGN